MIDTTQRCATNCGEPTSGAALCSKCEGKIIREVASLVGLEADFQTTITRQSVGGRSNSGSRSAERGLPWDDRASREHAALRGACWRWVLRIWDQVEQLPGAALDDMGRWLFRRVTRILEHPRVGALANEIHMALKRAWRVVDPRLPARVFAGVCAARTPQGRCPEWLYAEPGSVMVICPRCGRTEHVERRREMLREAAENVLVNATDLASAVTWMGESITPHRVRVWASRKRLVAKGTDRNGRPLYRVGDALDLLATQARRQGLTTRPSG